MIPLFDKENFEVEVLQSPIPALVGFWGPHCTSCLALMPDVEALSVNYDGIIKVLKVDALKNCRLCLELRGMGFPTFRLFDKGNRVKRITGEIYQQMLVDTVWGI